MGIIMQFWWVWGILALVSFLYGGYNQIGRMKRMMDGDRNIFQGIYTFLLAAVVNLTFTVLFIIGVVLKVIEHYKG